MLFSPAAFNALLGGAVRQDVVWRRAFACPCVSPSSGQSDPLCVQCGGIGWAWQAGVPAWCGIQNMTPSKAAAAFGIWEAGDATLTIPSDSPLYAVGKNDRIRVGDATTPFSQVVVPEVSERLIGEIVSIERVFWLVDGEVVDGDAPAVDLNGALTWPGSSPPDGVSFSITGRRRDELYVPKDLPANRNAGVTGLPRKLHARRFDLMGRSNGNEADFS